MRGRSARRASLTSTQRPPVRLPRARHGALLVVLVDGVEKELGEKQTLTVERCWRGRGRQASRAWAIGLGGHLDAAAAARPTTRTSKCGLPMVHRSAASCDSVTLKTPGGARGSAWRRRRRSGEWADAAWGDVSSKSRDLALSVPTAAARSESGGCWCSRRRVGRAPMTSQPNACYLASHTVWAKSARSDPVYPTHDHAAGPICWLIQPFRPITSAISERSTYTRALPPT